ncbi:hypothetical protein AMATHDRAFT_64711 [Amanita thiersii Skay4041]|uniref:Uncharacterized protein n=1 Tax=Amanita thiersii Skay4041 TaxID=703135 RepID=A0A2A9NLY2_9AGAR|nr:hypothetical protein AMATHDRAFT_64711 [Amanita thiersii Skay4041]
MTAATLRSLYNRATRAFLHREISLTHSLIQSAFSIIHPPSSLPDTLTDFRRKWDILRITLETLVYSSPPPPKTVLPDELNRNALQAPRALLKSMYTRSLALFTPTDGTLPNVPPNAAYLPSSVLLTLVYSSIKLNCPDAGQYIIEEWLARRDPLLQFDSSITGDPEGDGYAKVLEAYCLQILPKLEMWSDAREFLEYETELPEVFRNNLRTTLNNLHNQALAARQTAARQRHIPSPSPSTPKPRSSSPTPSLSSSSSYSTNSTHTIKASKPQNRNHLNSPSTFSNHQNGSSSSIASDTTATPNGYAGTRNSRHVPNGNHDPNHHHHGSARYKSVTATSDRARSSSSSHRTTSSSSPWSSHPFGSSHPPSTAFDSSTNPSTFALVKASLGPYLTLPKISTLLIIFVLFPVISFILRMRRRRQGRIGSGSGGSVTPLKNGSSGLSATGMASNADLVRKRLQLSGAGGDGNLVGKVWTEVVRMLVDTVKMAGSGLV